MYTPRYGEHQTPTVEQVEIPAGTTLFTLSVIANTWDDWDNHLIHDPRFTFCEWWVDANSREVPEGTPGAQCHQHLECAYGSGRIVIHRPSSNRA